MNDRFSKEPIIRIEVDGTYEEEYDSLLAVIDDEVAGIRWRRRVPTGQDHQETQNLPETKDRQACRVTFAGSDVAWQVTAEFAAGTDQYSRDETGITLSADGSSAPGQPLGPNPDDLQRLKELQGILFGFNDAVRLKGSA